MAQIFMSHTTALAEGKGFKHTFEHQQASGEYAQPTPDYQDNPQIQNNKNLSINVSVIPGKEADSDGKGGSSPAVGSVTVEGTPSTDPALTPSSIRRQMFLEDKEAYRKMMQDYKHSMKTAGAKQEWQKTIWGSQLKRFPVETLLFFVAIGVVNHAQLMFDYANNPLIMEQHLKSLTDPIGNLSFLAFMVANGYAHHFFDNPKLTTRFVKEDAANIFRRTIFMEKLRRGATEAELIQEAQKYTDGKYVSATKKIYGHLLPYLAMTAGSMASHLTGDIFHQLQACVKSFTPKKSADGKEKINDPLTLSEDPCDVAWREWTQEKKFNTYAPALASMMVSQALSTLVSIGFKKSGSGIFPGMGEALAGKQAFNFKLLGWTVLKEMNPLSLRFKAVQIIGHISNLTLFTALDQLVHHFVSDIVLNLTYGNYNPWFNSDAFPKKAENLYNILEKESKEKYQTLNSACVKDIQDYTCQSEDIMGFLHNFTETMTKWKEFNKTKPMTAHQNWLEMVNNFQATERSAFHFYREFLHDLQTTEYYRKNPIVSNAKPNETQAEKEARIVKEIESGSDSTEVIRDVPEMLNYIRYPLFGIEPTKGIADFDYSKWKDYYLSNPKKIQAYQLLKVKTVADEFVKYMDQNGYASLNLKYDEGKIRQVLSGLASDDLVRIGNAINLMRHYAEVKNAGASDKTQEIFRDFLEKLGRPAPLMYQGQGFSFAFELNSDFLEGLKNMVLPHALRNIRLSTQYSFSKKTDYFYYNMLCGPQVSSPEMISGKYIKAIFGINTGIPSGLQALFIPPALVSESVDADICSKAFLFKNSNQIYSDTIIDEKTGNKFKGVFQFIFKNFNTEIKSIIDASPKFNIAMGAEEFPEFTKWWESKIESKVIDKLNEFKEDYHGITVDLFETLFKENSRLGKDIVNNSIVFANMQEARTYSMIIAHVLKTLVPGDKLKEFIDTTNTPIKNYKITEKSDILLFQRAAYLQDFDAIKNGTTPVIFKFQTRLEELLTLYHNTLSGYKIKEVMGSKGKNIKVVDSIQDEVKTNELSKKSDELFKSIDEDLDKVMTLIAVPKENNKSHSVIAYAKAQLAKISKELQYTNEMINLMSLKITERIQKVVSKEVQESREERAKRLEEQVKKDCKSNHSTIGSKGGC